MHSSSPLGRAPTRRQKNPFDFARPRENEISIISPIWESEVPASSKLPAVKKKMRSHLSRRALERLSHCEECQTGSRNPCGHIRCHERMRYLIISPSPRVTLARRRAPAHAFRAVRSSPPVTAEELEVLTVTTDVESHARGTSPRGHHHAWKGAASRVPARSAFPNLGRNTRATRRGPRVRALAPTHFAVGTSLLADPRVPLRVDWLARTPARTFVHVNSAYRPGEPGRRQTVEGPRSRRHFPACKRRPRLSPECRRSGVIRANSAAARAQHPLSLTSSEGLSSGAALSIFMILQNSTRTGQGGPGPHLCPQSGGLYLSHTTPR